MKNLRFLREEKGLSQQKLAEMLNTSQQTIFKYEKTASEPDISTLVQIADIFDVTVDYLIGNSELREKDVKLNSVMLTEEEIEHIRLWRSLPNNLKTNINDLIKGIEKNI
ncbi:MAG: helix-turn-helix transcriptional regulator [Oscillospiraceae bacterium]|nr:helix-turn-helix transcriptional regulator [Oscillospiraceae bacterium]